MLVDQAQAPIPLYQLLHGRREPFTGPHADGQLPGTRGVPDETDHPALLPRVVVVPAAALLDALALGPALAALLPLVARGQGPVRIQVNVCACERE